MIPVTSFAGKTVAVFGLGGSGLASCHALKAGGAEVIAGDDGADRLAEAAKAGFVTADLRNESAISSCSVASGSVTHRTRLSSRLPAPTANPPPPR
jgi:UDP-N-acetylmuramoylalanine-D-glutamate ligase